MITESLHSLVIAQTMSLYLIIMSIIMLVRADHYRLLLSKLKADSGVIPVVASFSLVIGLMLVVVHNIWVMESELLITLVAWLIVIKSILWLAFPDYMLNMSKRIYKGSLFYVMTAITALIGILLISHGFYLFL